MEGTPWNSVREPPRLRAATHGRSEGVNLALQGGGAHGAFAWGVLDRLLEEEALAIEGISATSAGAMNAAVLAHGLTARRPRRRPRGAARPSGSASPTRRGCRRCSPRPGTG